MTQLTKKKKLDLESEMRSKLFDENLIPIVLAYKVLGPMRDHQKYSFEDFEDDLTLLCIVFVELNVDEDQVKSFKTMNQFGIEPIFTSNQPFSTDALICKKLEFTQITKENIKSMSIKGCELQTEVGDVDLNYHHDRKRFKLSNQKRFN